MKPAIAKVLAVRVSPVFTAILDHALGDGHPRTFPSLTALAVMRDGFPIGWNTAHPHKEGFLGSASDLDRNTEGLCEALGLDAAETKTVVDTPRAQDR